MRLKIEIIGDCEKIDIVKKEIAEILQKYFNTYKFIWEENKGGSDKI